MPHFGDLVVYNNQQLARYDVIGVWVGSSIDHDKTFMLSSAGEKILLGEIEFIKKSVKIVQQFASVVQLEEQLSSKQ